ncbi:MAG: 4Fe-4S binding protein [Sphaerospermopsis sp.]|nr:4Fe-4S binding protein [Sphaerospermopsis sp.]
MFNRISETLIHKIRWVLTILWLGLIASFVYDPLSSILTKPENTWSPLRLSNTCIQVQDKCLSQQPYPLGTTLFWGAIIPISIFILLVFGHEMWRRICPLSFLSQIPRSLGWQRQIKREDPKTGKIRYELVKIKPDSWLGKNYSYVQFAWLFVGLCGRILFFNADRLMLTLWILFTIAFAITVGYLYSGKSWCNYFCPMATVQRIYSEPAGLFSSQAHTSEELITQSMCRTTLPDGKEKSACVACQNPCIDIDSEKTYWADLKLPESSFLRYGYVGLVIGYFVYYYLYAGNWDYYFSGIWARETDQLASLFAPGFYLLGTTVNIPKIVAVPMTLGGFTALGYGWGKVIEKKAKAYSLRHHLHLSIDTIRHRIFTICTFGIFNFFFIFAGLPLIILLPLWIQYLYDILLVILSTMWLYKTWKRTPDIYSRESVANRLRKQLEKLDINLPKYLDGRSIKELNTHEIYVLAKVLPSFTKNKLYHAYKGVAREFLVEGKMKYSEGLEVLQKMAQELEISEDEHWEILNQLGVENVEIINSPLEIKNVENNVENDELLQKLQDLTQVLQKHFDKILYVPTKYTGFVLVKDSLQKLRRSQEKEK